MPARNYDNDPSQERVRELFEYTEEDSMYPLVRKVKVRGPKRTGAPSDRYIREKFDGFRHQYHRLVWIYHHGKIPEGYQVDHKDRNTKNNIISNLRLFSHGENQRNRILPNKSGYIGLALCGSRWQVHFRDKEGAQQYVATYGCKLEAARAYDAAMDAHFGPNHPYPTNASEGRL